MEFNFKIQNDRLEAVGSPSGVTGNINTYVCNFDITCNISDLIWFCVFKQGTKAYDKIMENNTCLIPYEVLTNPEPLYIGCFGKKADGELKQVSTNMVYFDLKQGAYEVGDIPAEPPEDAYTILLKSLKAPYIGENGNWYEWNAETLTYVDSGVSAKGGGEAVTDEQIQEAVNNYLEENPVDLTGYVKEESGKGLSSNDFTDADKQSIHTHDNKDVLDGITSEKVAEWDNKSGGGTGENWVQLVDETLTENLATEFRQVFDKPYKKLRLKIIFKGDSKTTLSNVRFKRTKSDGNGFATSANYLKLNPGSLSNNRCFSATASFDIDDTIVITDGCLTTGLAMLAQNNATFGSEKEYSKEDQNFPEFYFYLGGTISDDGTLVGNVIGPGTTIKVWGCE